MPSILLAYDDSPSASRALELLARCGSGRESLAVDVLNVQPAPLTLWPGAQAQFDAIRHGLLEAARSTTEAAVRRLATAGVAATTVTRIGSPADLVLQEARDRGVAAIAMGTRGHGLAGGFAIGSVAMRVAHGGAAPVFLVKPADRLPAAPGTRLRVLLAADGSPAPVRAAERLASWREWLGELAVDVVWVQPPLTLLEAMLPPHDDVIRQWSTREGEQASEGVRAVLARAGIVHQCHRVVGDPGTELPALAERLGAELMILGTRGLGAAHHALVGSVALKACAASSVPTLLVP